LTLRLRQICLVTAELEPAVAAMHAVFGLAPCHRDPAVAKYGLVNALFVFGRQFLEIVAPASGQADDGTAAGRFLQRSRGRGGYIAIFDTHDPQRRKVHAERLGIRVAHEMDVPGLFWGIQLHPRDCRAAMLEFDQSACNDDPDGAYWPAGPHWQAHRQDALASGIPWIEVESADAAGLAAHWARIIDVPVLQATTGPELRFDMGAARFVPTDPGEPAERLCAVALCVAGPARAIERAAARGLPLRGAGFDFCGVTILPQPIPGDSE
jgi:hypothetical protein